MIATTIKIENPLLGQMREVMPRDKSVSAFVREIIEKEIRRRKMIDSAEQYTAFLQTHTGERSEMEDWEKSDLESIPKKSSRRKTT